ncbi:MAG: MBOAT family protein [Eggerthellaceae bacterium]|nr:MBOAT family protein [Eggerthellaceae bacterium]
MQFYSVAFIAFLVAALVAYYAVGKLAGKGQWIVLLVASLAFYAYNGIEHFIFIGTTALSTWGASRAFASIAARVKKERMAAESTEAKKAAKKRGTTRKRLVLAATLLVNFGILAYIKYATVLVGYLAPESGWKAGILLPLGISFYTFQTISYVVDTYNAKYEPERNFAKYLLFVSFFPQLIQGPINRFDELAHQLYAKRALDWYNIRRGLLLAGYGLLKVYAIGNVLVICLNPILDNINPSTPGSLIVMGILMYAIYQYANFSGGIDMVLGFAKMFGIEMAPNFRQPYFSVSLTDFWRRWHITLGAWMRDYVFYPFVFLPGVKKWSRGLTARYGKHLGRTLPVCVASIIVFFIVGLWHGAELHFILWGLYNGLIIAASDLLTPLWARMNKALHINMEGRAHHVFCIVRTFIVVNIGWYFDRIVSFGDTIVAFHNTLFSFQPAAALPLFHTLTTSVMRGGLVLAGCACIIVLVVSILKERNIDVADKLLSSPAIVRGLAWGVIIVFVATSFVFARPGGFMYANF